MSEFFEPLPAPPELPEQEKHRRPAWFGPPDNELGAPVPIQVELVRTENLALAIIGIVAFSTGFSFTFAIRRRVLMRQPNHHHPVHPFHSGASPDALRFGIQFANGGKATTLDRHPSPRDVDETPTGPLLIGGGGGGGGRKWNSEMWVWPLPPPGALAFVCAWKAESIPLTRREIDAKLILDSASQVEQLWPDKRPEPSGAGTAYGG
jgi:hypothetical protein